MLVPLMFLVGCDDSDVGSPMAQIQRKQDQIIENQGLSASEHISVWVDPETGVNYILYTLDRTGAITPRLNRNGLPYVEENK